MPVSKGANSTLDAMKSEGNDSLDTIIKHAIGREPLHSFSKTADNNPVQWIQLLNAFEQPDRFPILPGLKFQMQKCEKCSREFCSPINYRRHIRVHRRSLNIDKESHKSRDLLGGFWDKLSVDEAKEILSFHDVVLEDVPGDKILDALVSLVRRTPYHSFPQAYVNAGSLLLDVIEAGDSKYPITSQDFFSFLDDASEKTFLCAGMAESMRRYVFDGDAGKIGLEMKNIVACTSFLVEQKLVRAWLAEKDAEALRFQKLLMEEEEADQRRQAEMLERKRQKKLRQKKHKLKGQSNEEKEECNDVSAEPLENAPVVEEPSIPPAATDAIPNTVETPQDHSASLREIANTSFPEDDGEEAQFRNEQFDDRAGRRNGDYRTMPGGGHRHVGISRWQVPKHQKSGRNGFHTSQNSSTHKPETTQRYGGSRVVPVGNGGKVWTRKPKSETDGEKKIKSRSPKEPVNQNDDGESTRSRQVKEVMNQEDQLKKLGEVIIGSIPITLRNCTDQQNGESRENHNGVEKPNKTDAIQNGLNRPAAVKLWRPVSRNETRSGVGGESRVDVVISKDSDQIEHGDSSLKSRVVDDNGCEIGGRLFSGGAAKAFLAQRWKEATSGDHVTLVLSSESKPQTSSDVAEDKENSVEKVGASEHSTTGTSNKGKLRNKPEKGAKVKYIAKQRNLA